MFSENRDCREREHANTKNGVKALRGLENWCCPNFQKPQKIMVYSVRLYLSDSQIIEFCSNVKTVTM